MTRLSVRLTDEEERLLVRRARNAGMKKATFVRHLIREESFTTANEALVDAEQRMRDMHLRIAQTVNSLS